MIQTITLQLGTPVHWAVLNSRPKALKILLDEGCCATPMKPKSNNRSSAAVESPLEICDRLYGSEPKDEKGVEMRQLLLSYMVDTKK